MNNNINIENNNTTPVVQTTPIQVPTTPVVQTTPVQVPTTPVAQTASIEISSMTPENSTTTEPKMTTIQHTKTTQSTQSTTPQEQKTNVNNTTEQNNKNILQYIPIILLILVLALGGYVGAPKIKSLISKDKNEITDNAKENNNTNKNEQNNNNNNENNTNNNIENTPNNNEITNNNQNNVQQENNTNQTCATPPIWNGVYTNGEHSVTLYQNEQNEITYSVKIDTHLISGIADKIVGNKASGEIFETHTFELCNDTLTFTTTDEDVPTTIFTKNKDYNQNDFFTDTYGDPAFLNTEINGIFKKGTTTLKLFQTSATSASVTIIDNNSYFGKTLNITNNMLSYEDDFFDEIQKINITINGNTLTLTASSTDQESYLNSYSGTYTKESSYTMEQIIEDN